MRLGFSAWAMPRLPVDQQVAIVREAGYDAIELVVGPDRALDAERLDAGERRRIRRLVDDAGLALPSIAGHARLLGVGPEEHAAALARLRANLDLAAELAGPEGAPCVVTMVYGQPERYEADRERIAELLGEAVEHAARRGVVLALEPHVGQAIDLPERCVWLLERVGSPHFRLNLDNSHFEVMGRDAAEYVPALVPWAVHTHLKDQRGRYPGHEFMVPGEGDMDYRRYLGLLREAGYRGAVTVEISTQVQRRPDYDPAAAAAASLAALRAAL